MRLGFIGTGVITKAVVTGLVRSGFVVDGIFLSPRNAATAAGLAALDPRVRVCEGNQQVLDSADTVCLAVLPQIVSDVTRELQFSPRHRVISFVPGTTVDELRRLVDPAGALVRAVPLPAVADGKGCTAIYPPEPVSSAMFSALGRAVEVDGEDQFDALHAVTATMASFYAALEAQAQWLVRQGVPYPAARAFLSGYSVGLAHETTQTDQSFPDIIEHLMTPGGLNEQLHAELAGLGAYSHYGPALDRILLRVQGRA